MEFIRLQKCPVNIASGTLTNGVYGTKTTKQVFAATNDSVISATFTGSFCGFAMGANAIILPVDLLYFEIFAQKENEVLKWSTACNKGIHDIYDSISL